MTRDEIELALAATIDAESAVGIRWWPGRDIASVAYRRWYSFARRHKIRRPSDEQRIDDLAKGLQAHFEPEHRTAPSQWLHLCKLLAAAIKWHAGKCPAVLFSVLRASGKASERKLRLFNCACVRRIWPLLKDVRSREIVEVAERFADGLANLEELIMVQAAAGRTIASAPDGRFQLTFTKAADSAANAASWAGYAIVPCESGVAGAAARAVDGLAMSAEQAAQAALLRDIFPFPGGLAPALDPAWLTPTVITLARAIYEEPAFDRLAILADALEESGCTNQDILSHCRGSAEHARGCFALDLLLGKE